LDIDQDYDLSDPQTLAQQELVELKDPTNCFENWIAFVKDHDWIWPCIQTTGQTKAELRKQIEAFQSLGRPYCMRLTINIFPDNIDDVVGAFADVGSSDFAIILEGGWTNDPLSLAAKFVGTIGSSLSAIDATVPIVVSCTSMPKMFDMFNKSVPTCYPFTNRLLVEQVGRSSNRARIIYGDWASTRPRETRGMASRPLDRIDYPTEQAWYISRNKDLKWDFRNAAIAVKNSEVWDGKLGIWGEEQIRNTTINMDLGINTPQKNVAARVNIHLHRQAFHGQLPVDTNAFDEEWTD